MQKITAAVRINTAAFVSFRNIKEIEKEVVRSLGRELGHNIAEMLRQDVFERQTLPQGMRMDITDLAYENSREYRLSCGVITEQEYVELKAAKDRFDKTQQMLIEYRKELEELRPIKEKYGRLQAALKEVTG